jgi:hypothetical protein
MKLVVLGATGGIGLEIIRQAIEHGHSVTAFVRSPERLERFQGRIAIKQGDPLSSPQLERAIEGHDAVLSGFGPRVPVAKTDAKLLRDFADARCSVRVSSASWWCQRHFCSGIRSFHQLTCSGGYSFRPSLSTRKAWSGLYVRADSTGRSYGHPNLPTSLSPAIIAFERAICPGSASIFHAPIWPIVSSRLSKIAPP